MKAFTIKIDYIEYDERTGKKKVIKKNVLDELGQLYEFEMMNAKDNGNPFYAHLDRGFIKNKVKKVIKEEDEKGLKKKKG